MRYYNIWITDLIAPVMNFTSYDFTRGKTTAGALNVEFDIPIATADVPLGNAHLRIWGVGLDIINNASQLANFNITIAAGFQRGLPLANAQVFANPIRNGVILSGTILQAFGNWQGTEQSLDLIISPQLYPSQAATVPDTPFMFQCLPGAPLSPSIVASLVNLGIPDPVVNVSPLLVAPEGNAVQFFGENIVDFAKQLNRETKRINKLPSYIGALCVKTESGYMVTDNTTPTPPKIINFTDMIGQPTWLDTQVNGLEIQIKTMMRSDISVGDTVSLDIKNIPILSSQQRQNQFLKNNVAFTGTGFVSFVRHIGNMRQQDANAWVTIINVIPNQVLNG